MTNQPTIAELLKDLREESTLLLREEIALAKKEISEKISSTALSACHEISVSDYAAIRTNCIVPFSVERVGTNIYLCDLLF